MTNIERLFELPTFSSSAEAETTFHAALKDELVFHYDNNELYRQFCDRKGFDPHGDFRLEDIPPVAVSVFKQLGRDLGSVPKNEITLTLQSSATSGVPSSVVVDKETSRRQAKAMVRVVEEVIGKGRKPFLIMDIDPRSQFMRLLGARFAAVTGYLKFASKVGYFLKVSDEGLSYFDVEAMHEYVASLDQNQPVVLFGFTYILYANVLKGIEGGETKVQLPKGSKIIHIGGWKKLESEKVSKEKFNAELAACFGIAPDDIVDIYGFTEQMGLNYPDFKDGWKHTSAYSRVLVRDVATHELLPAGQQGMLEFVSPIPHSYPGNVVLTDDIGMIDPDTTPDAIGGTRFKILGRVKKAEIRGCGDILSQKLTFAKKNRSEKHEDKLQVLSHGGELTATDAVGQMREVIAHLRQKQEWMRQQPADALIGLIASVAGGWATDPSLSHLKDKGLIFVSSWCDEAHLRSVVSNGLRGNVGYLDGYQPFPDSDHHLLRANARGLVCHWLAGNVQILGLFALVQSIIAKNVNLLKVSSRDDGVFESLLNGFRGKSYTTPGGYTISGDDLLKTISLVYFPHSADNVGREMSAQADVRIAWGGQEAVTTVANYPSRIGAETVVFGPKLSCAVISKEMLSDEHSAKKLARRVSVDVSVFDQTGCASPHNLFVERGGAVSPSRFVEILADCMGRTEKQIPKPPVSAEEIAAIHSIRGVYDFKGRVVGSQTMSWTLLLDDRLELCAPVYSRTLFVHEIENICDVTTLLNEDIQTVGIEAPMDKASDFATRASAKGVARFPQLGRMLNFEMPWDGIFLLDRLVRWSTLGGPLR